MSLKQLNSNPSFMNDESGSDEKTLPLGVGDLGDEMVTDPLAGAGESRRIGTGSIILGAVVLVACCGLWTMRSLSHVSAAGMEDRDVERNIVKFLDDIKGKDGDGQSGRGSRAGYGVLSVLTESYSDRQVPLGEVQRDPFVLPGEDSINVEPTTEGTGDSAANLLARRKAEREATITRAADRFALKSVIMGNQPLANVSGKIVREGDELFAENENVVLRVVKITGESITLSATDNLLGIAMEFNIQIKRD